MATVVPTVAGEEEALQDDPPGRVVAVRGSVVEIAFDGPLPLINEALQITQNLLAVADARWRVLSQSERSQLMVVGQRGLRQLLAHGLKPNHGEPAATSLEGIQDLVKRLASLLGRLFASGEIRSLHVIYNRYQSISEQIPTEVQVYPPDLTSVRKPHSAAANPYRRYLSKPDLLSGLIDEYAFISLYLLAVESYASEQASRLVAMDNSTRNTETMLGTLIDRERRERQDLIMREVMDLIAAPFASESGVEAGGESATH
jgi:F-type H+-transporting ATPase subunit gamma